MRNGTSGLGEKGTSYKAMSGRSVRYMRRGEMKGKRPWDLVKFFDPFGFRGRQ
jgi:hypothetical protein